MIQQLYAMSAEIASAIRAMAHSGSLPTSALSLIALGGLIAGFSPTGLAGAVAIMGQLLPSDPHIDRTNDMLIASAFSCGMIVALAAIGIVSASAGGTVVNLGVVRWIPAITLVMGLHMLGWLRWSWFRLNIAIEPRRTGPASAFLIGVPFGLAGSPCTMPILITVLSVTAATGSVLFGMLGLISFALGRSIPIFAIALCSSQMRVMMPRNVGPLRYFRPVLGALIALVSVYFLTFGREILA